MKKAFIIVLMMVSVFLLFAGEGDGVYSGVTDYAFRPTSLDREKDFNYSLFGNPAGLAHEGLRIQLPYIESSSFNVSEALKDRKVAEALSELTKLHFSDKNNWITYLLGLVMATGSGYNDVISVDQGFGIQMGNLAMGFNGRMQIKSMPKINGAGELETTSSALGNGYVPELDTSFTIAYGMRLLDTDVFSLDAGASVRYAHRVYMLQINTDQISGLINGSTDFSNLPARGGFAFPIDLGVTLGFLDSRLQVQASATNLNGFYYMRNYENSEDAWTYINGSAPYEIYTPFSINAGVSFSPMFRIVNPTVSLFFDGINLYFENAKDSSQKGLEVLRFIDASASVTVFDILRLRASYRYGYPEFAVGANAWGSLIELSYGFHEAGKEYGLKPVDKLTVRFRLGLGN